MMTKYYINLEQPVSAPATVCHIYQIQMKSWHHLLTVSKKTQEDKTKNKNYPCYHYCANEHTEKLMFIMAINHQSLSKGNPMTYGITLCSSLITCHNNCT